MVRLIDTRLNEVEILSLILKDKDSRLEAMGKLKIEYFSNDLHKRLFKTIETMEKNQNEIDLTLVLQKMNELSLMEDGDISSISEIYSSFSSLITLNSHINSLVDGYRSNEFKKKMLNYVTSEKKLDTDEVINNLNRTIENKEMEHNSVIQMQEWLLDEISKKMELDKPKPLGILTGYRDLDKIIKGLVPGSLITLLARSGIGKTTFSIELAKKIALKGEKLLYCSLEMPPEQIYLKMVLMESKLKIGDYIAITKHSNAAIKDLSIGSNKISSLGIDFSQERNIDKIINLINYYVRKKHIKTFFIDYLNIVQSDIKTNNTDILYNEITAELKQVALKTGAVIFLVTQASRAVDGQNDKRPNLKDIKSSSSIEQNSDYIIALYRNLDFNFPVKRDELFRLGKINYNTLNADLNPECFEVSVLKNRHTGECGTAYLKYLSNLGYLDWPC
ncbi:DnaB-like helicase C-terminal domain-containing protein [Clostridium algidicarnis]|uniref:DnaB-like helicase C-terminal domain-containing protein n=1 Tax=Clostridium algidicarnis TaxID=37659 RepID=UPI001C0E1750|nr:DnaB-like helicase C-terminal domain-containing protein [Clostridium algidicarnis]MBU3203736.1 replicative DNA helicase [Clostridium algidicarnis]MBU3211890.1 replicative DNA helicase [Clostridium algidicarnis]MBU3221604.1 replicative DNA helicase [Clostridium algidicarnis]